MHYYIIMDLTIESNMQCSDVDFSLRFSGLILRELRLSI